MLRDKIISELNDKKVNKNLRALKKVNKNHINLSSNDYINLGQDKKLKKEFFAKYMDKISFSSSSSRLLTGNYDGIINLEEKLQEIYGKDSLAVNSGYNANTLIIKTFFNKESLIITDRLNHASIYDGIIDSKAKIVRYNHLDVENLEKLLEKYHNNYEDILVVTETIYSMSGDMADISKIVELKKRFKFSLMVDEAHSYGVYGYGIAKNQNLVKDIDFLVIPLGKGGGSVGSYILLDKIYKEYIINFGREFIYTTALPPINHYWNLFILENMSKFKEREIYLRELKTFAHNELKKLGIKTKSTTHILSLQIGDNEKADIISEKLQRKGYIVYPIKSPTIPKGTEMIRVSLTSNISKETLGIFLKEFKNEYDNLF